MYFLLPSFKLFYINIGGHEISWRTKGVQIFEGSQGVVKTFGDILPEICMSKLWHNPAIRCAKYLFYTFKGGQ